MAAVDGRAINAYVGTGTGKPMDSGFWYLCCVFKPYRAKAFARLPPIQEFHFFTFSLFDFFLFDYLVCSRVAKEYTVPLVVRNPTVGEQEPHGIYSPTVGSERKTVRLFLKLTTGFQWMGVFTRSEKRPIRTLLLYYS